MTVIELILISIGLAADAFAVSVCKGLSVGRAKARHYFLIGLWFGGFQALMPLVGYYLGSALEKYVTAVDHWIAFVLLLAIGLNMIKESMSEDEDSENASFSVKTMFLMAAATSIDALAVGITFALLPGIKITAAVLFIGVVTFIFSAAGVRIGNVFGAKYKSKAELAGGVILILIGVKILLEHLEIINF